jgi:hypothetical protein
MILPEAVDMTPADRQALHQQFTSIVNFLSHPMPGQRLQYVLVYGAPVTTAALDDSLRDLWRN